MGFLNTFIIYVAHAISSLCFPCTSEELQAAIIMYGCILRSREKERGGRELRPSTPSTPSVGL